MLHVMTHPEAPWLANLTGDIQTSEKSCLTEDN